MIIDRAIVRSSEQHKSILHSAFAFGFRKYVTYIQCDHWVSENIDEFVLNAHTNSIAATQIDDYRIHIQEFPYIFFFFGFLFLHLQSFSIQTFDRIIYVVGQCQLRLAIRNVTER